MLTMPNRKMNTYDDKTQEPIAPKLAPNEKRHVFVTHDESIFHTGEYPGSMWCAPNQQPLRKKGNGRAIHVSAFMCEEQSLALRDDEVQRMKKLPQDQHLEVTDSRKIIYPGKGHNAWWDLPQLMVQLEHTVDIFEHLMPDAVGVWAFDCSSAHEGFAPDALNVNNMRVNPGKKQPNM
jgi:hypothetical protein